MKVTVEDVNYVIGPGALVRLKSSEATSLKDKMARWVVLGLQDDAVLVRDHEDYEDVRTFEKEQLERVKGGSRVVTERVVDVEEPVEDCEPSLFYRDDVESLFDDPLVLSAEEDDEDEDEDE